MIQWLWLDSLMASFTLIVHILIIFLFNPNTQMQLYMVMYTSSGQYDTSLCHLFIYVYKMINLVWVNTNQKQTCACWDETFVDCARGYVGGDGHNQPSAIHRHTLTHYCTLLYINVCVHMHTNSRQYTS